jgi:uncharacterized peroxidase-related enzyme
MTRVKSINLETAGPKVKEIYQAIEKKMGKVPNIFLNMGNSASVLQGYLALSDAASHTSLDPKLREEIALAVGQANNCNYCLSAHTAIGGTLGITREELIEARKGHAKNPKNQAILTFAKTVISKKGNVTAEEVEALKKTGVTDAELVEIILVISLNMFTNYFNHITDPKIDFPIAPALT